MRYIGKSKMSKMHPKPDMHYPSLRLPKACDDAIGETVHIFETTHKSFEALLVVLRDYTSKYISSVAQPVAQPEAEVVQPEAVASVESRLKTLESEFKR